MKKALNYYFHTLAAAAFTAVVIIGKNPITFTKNDWLHASNSLWAGLLPVITKALNPGNAEFGLFNGSSSSTTTTPTEPTHTN